MDTSPHLIAHVAFHDNDIAVPASPPGFNRRVRGDRRALAWQVKEAVAICAKIDRGLPAAEARADRLIRLYGL